MAKADTLMIGDSIFALTEEVPDFLLEAGLDFELRAKSGSKMEIIAQQYRDYKKDTGIPETVIMDGGGNNVLQDHYIECVKQSDLCDKAIDKIFGTGQALLEEMKEDGVKKIVYVGIHYFKKWNAGLNPTVDKGTELAKTICQPELCWFIDLRPHFDRPGLLLKDDIHPNTEGSRIIADLILGEIWPDDTSGPIEKK
jgi:hypothetical protein